MNPTLIESSEQMDALAVQLADVKLIAVDTEFFRETTYYPQLALVQIATDSIVACIDPLAFDAKDALKAILLNEDIIKIFHSCSQDLEVLYYYLGQIPTAIYDTQIANALLTSFHQIGYASLVENELGVTLDKSQTRTNWLQRPLTDKQIQYAGDDVFFLYQLHEKLDSKLHDLGRKPWFDEDSESLINNTSDFKIDNDKLWRRVKGASRLPRKNLAVAQAIAIWREHLAQQYDKTRRRMLADEIVNNLAFNPPEDINSLNKGMTNKYQFTDTESQQLLSAIKEAMASAAESWPDNQFDVLNPEQKQLLKSLQNIVSDVAENLDIASAVLCSKKDLEILIFHFENHQDSALPAISIVQGWRYRCVGQRLVETFN